MTSRRALLRLRARIVLGDRAGALREIDAEIERREPPIDPAQTMFVVMRFRCLRLNATMSVKECLEKRGAKWVTGGRRGAPMSHECVGCETGNRHEWLCPGIRLRPAKEPPAVMPASQRLAKRARALTDPDCRVCADMDPLREAAMATPDDRSEWK